ncbi:hypothetical protein [Roseibium sp. Sym1]|nr:hypothetical protein [Roseibium sp. Sym1]
MLAALGDTTFLAWGLPLLATALLFGVYFRIKSDTPKDFSDH